MVGLGNRLRTTRFYVRLAPLVTGKESHIVTKKQNDTC